MRRNKIGRTEQEKMEKEKLEGRIRTKRIRME